MGSFGVGVLPTLVYIVVSTSISIDGGTMNLAYHTMPSHHAVGFSFVRTHSVRPTGAVPIKGLPQPCLDTAIVGLVQQDSAYQQCE